jgi:Flp pilus assembly pilin Flp
MKEVNCQAKTLHRAGLAPGGNAFCQLTLVHTGEAPEEERIMSLYLWLKNLLDSEEGQDLIEYALIIVLVVIAGVVLLPNLGTAINNTWQTVINQLGGS